MGKIGLEKFYMCIAIPQCICAIILISLVLTFSTTDWDQDVIDYTVDTWKQKAIQDVVTVVETSSCPSGYSAADYWFPGTVDLCQANRGTNAGRLLYRKCGTISEKEAYESCTTKDGRRTCSTKYRTKQVSEGSTIQGFNSQQVSNFLGKKICYKKGTMDYFDISKERQLFTTKKDITVCTSPKISCGGSRTTDTDTDYAFCFKPEGTSNKCPLQDFDLTFTADKKSFTETIST